MKTLFLKSTSFFFITLLLVNCSDDASKKLEAPISIAGPDIVIILPTASVEVDGSLSSDPDGEIQSYLWEKISGPATSTIASPTNSTTSISDLTEGIYSFRLTVTDNDSKVAKDSLTVEVSAEQFYFVGDMADLSITTNGSNELVLNGWDELRNHELIEDFEINNIGGIPYAFQEIVDDPVNVGTKTLHATILDDDPDVSGMTRAQVTMRFKDEVDLLVYHTSLKVYLSPDIEFFENYGSSIVWFTISEFWNQHVDAWTGDGSGSARWNLATLKETGTGKPFYWRIESEYMQPERAQIWRYNNHDVPVPFGKWFTLDIYMKRGEGTNGKFKVTITPEGESAQVVFDVDDTTIYPGHPELHLKSWQNYKLYLDDVYLDWFSTTSTNTKQISAWYKDFRWHKN